MAMFSIHDFIMDTLRGMVGHYPDFQTMEYALNWYAKGKLDESDLAQVQEWIEALHPAPEPEPEPEPEEDPETEDPEEV